MTRRRRERGAAAVEAVLVTPIFVLLVLGIIEFALFFQNNLSASDAVKAGVRMASAEGRNANFAQDAADRVATAGGAMNKNNIEELWVYKANATDEFPQGFSVLQQLHGLRQVPVERREVQQDRRKPGLGPDDAARVRRRRARPGRGLPAAAPRRPHLDGLHDGHHPRGERPGVRADPGIQRLRTMRRITVTPLQGLRARRDERGYIAVTTGLILIVLMSFCAFAVDVGNWYLTGQRAQRAADAAALAGVTKLPGNQAGAFAMAQSYSANNGFKDGTASTTVTRALSGGPTRLRVDVTRTVDNIFGPLLGKPRTTISRYAVADFAGPVPLGSPCNRFGDDPDPNS